MHMESLIHLFPVFSFFSSLLTHFWYSGDSRKDGESARLMSQSETNLRLAGTADGPVNIEIRGGGQAGQYASSEDVMARLGGSRLAAAAGRLGLHPSVSVVNLRTSAEAGGGGSSANPPHHHRYFPSQHAKYFQVLI